MLYSHLHHHSASQRHNIKDRRMNKGRRKENAGRKTQEDFFTIIFTSQFIAKVRKGCSRFACERVLETKHKLHILTSTTYDRHVVSFLFSWCSTGGLGLTLTGVSEDPLGRVWLPYNICLYLSGILLATALGPNSKCENLISLGKCSLVFDCYLYEVFLFSTFFQMLQIPALHKARLPSV